MTNKDTFAGPMETVAIIGAGTMGAQIGALAAAGGYAVRIFDTVSEALERARGRIEKEIMPAIYAAGLRVHPVKEALGNISYPASLESALAGADLVIEAIKEDLEVKRLAYTEISRLAPTAILATNSSSIPSAAIADAVSGPERFLNMHFFAPIWVRSMLELMGCGRTSEETLARARDFGESLGLATAIVQGQSKGFIINRIWRAVKRESLRVIDEGVATPEEVDRLWKIFFQTGYAPFAIMDMVGLDVVRDIERSYQAVSGDPTDRPSATLQRLIEAGDLGEKTGKGFYEHTRPDPS